MKIKLPVTWEAFGIVEIEANSIEEAVNYFNETSDYLNMIENSEYVDGSFRLSESDPDFIKLFQ